MPATLKESDIIAYYDDCQDDYQIVWHLNSHMCMHYGYWDKTTPNLRSALLKMNARVAELADLKPGYRVLDAGCGVGGSSIYYATRFGCEVEGITLSAKQVQYAQQKVSELKLEKKINFTVGNYTHTPYPDEYFDAVLAIESVCHAPDKRQFLQEAHRVLKKGGVLVVADFFSNHQASDEPKNHLVMRKWAMSWAVPAFEWIESFKEKAHFTGFADTRSINVTSHILASSKRLYYCFIPGIICHTFLRVFGKRTSWHKANVWSTLYQYKSLKKNLWSYHFVKATKEN
ncbi:MAG: SAM-dependent methyltransferase [Adhaeribacter sp.]|nr:SAM-dependent methyltransferase [Adhaeribacter sp.]